MGVFSLHGIKLDIEIVGGEFKVPLGVEHFEHLIQVQDYALPGKPNVGIALPTAELCFTHADIPKITGMLKLKELKVNMAITCDETDRYEYRATNFDIEFVDGKVKVTIFLILDLMDFINKASQKSFKDKTLQDVLKSLTTIKADIAPGVMGDKDKMTWIQGNVSEYQFISEAIKHAVPKDPKDLILAAMNGKELTVTSYNEVIKKSKDSGQTIYISSSADGSANNGAGYKAVYSSSNAVVETSIGVYQYLLSVESLPVIKVLTDKVVTDGGMLFWGGQKKGVVVPFKSDRVQAPKFDCGNVFEGYWETQLANEKKLANIYRNLIYLDTVGQVATKINVLDPVYYSTKTDATAADSSKTCLDGGYCVFGVSKFIGKQSVSSRITIAKAEY